MFLFWGFFLRGEGGGPGRAKPREKTSRKFLKFSFLKSLQMYQILTISSYIWRTHLLILLNSSLSNYLPPPLAPPLAMALEE